jgi:hypothetical protein
MLSFSSGIKTMFVIELDGVGFVTGYETRHHLPKTSNKISEALVWSSQVEALDWGNMFLFRRKFRIVSLSIETIV